MATWSGIRHKLETEYLAEALQGHIQYFCTSYSKSPDHNGRASIRLDGAEILRGCYWNQWLLPRTISDPKLDEDALQVGAVDQQSFYRFYTIRTRAEGLSPE